MRRLIVLTVLLATRAQAQVPPILQAMRDSNWTLAASIAAANPDPVAAKLVTFIRLLKPDQASATEIDQFITANPTWPDQPVLEQRYLDALASEPDQRRVVALCRDRPPVPAGLPACAAAFAITGDPARAARAARTAWVFAITQPQEEEDFLARWSAIMTPSDEWRRFNHLIAAAPQAAARQLDRLDAPTRALAAARLALRTNAPNALASVAAVPGQARADPLLLLDEGRFLRRAHATPAALDLWRSAALAAEAASPPADRPAFATEREALARDLIDAGDPQNAYLLANDTTLSPDQALETDFLAGFIALRLLHDPARAATHFQALAAASHSAITQARAYYWLARSSPDTAAADFAQAAAWPLTYYGQLAAREAGKSEAALDQAIAAQHDPAATPAQSARFRAGELTRAAIILVGWADQHRAADFLLRLAQAPADAPTRALAAQLALRLNMPDVAVQIARLAGRDGIVLAQSGWPIPYKPPPGPVQPALILGLMRQESSFDPQITSHAGAQGLMQLMAPTAAQLAHALHAAAAPLSDPQINIRLGEAYFAGLLSQFGGVVPYALAAYNAGPHRVHLWLSGSTAGSGADAMTDWIELIPYAETRNYVQRVLESATIYQARAGVDPAGSAPQ
jgi:soluble lytic murein transglycosylase